MIAELVAGYEGYVAVTLALIVAYISWRKGRDDGTQHGIEATLVILEAVQAISLLQIVMVNSILLPINTINDECHKKRLKDLKVLAYLVELHLLKTKYIDRFPEGTPEPLKY